MTTDLRIEHVRFSPRGEPDVLLEGRLHVSAGQDAPAGVATTCHPDPRVGGTMDYPVVVAVAQALAEVGIATLRFNFRGVGESGGAVVGDAVVEQRDAAGALDVLAGRFGAKPRFIVGYSFGALVALRLAEIDSTIAGAAMLALPQTYVLPDEPAARSLPRLFVIAENDQLTDPEWAVDFAARCCPPARTLRLPGANHFLWNREPQIAQAVAGFLREILP
jgi:uncharacterized protein